MRSTPCVGEVEVDLNPEALGQIDCFPKLFIRIVPTKHYVLPGHADSRPRRPAMKAHQVRERDIEAPANTITTIAVIVAAID